MCCHSSKHNKNTIITKNTKPTKINLIISTKNTLPIEKLIEYYIHLRGILVKQGKWFDELEYLGSSVEA
jgi:hypothetical protein